jgi:DMSO/TMAO reductase YedYZ molybdopterin-dependent catalytic subunit
VSAEYPSAVRELAKLAVAIPALYVAFVLFGLGPVGWLVLAGVVLVGGAVVWRAQQELNRALETVGAERRFTGSRPADGDSGNAFPVTSWMADDPDRIDPDDWTLRVDGLVAESLELDTDAIGPDSERRALLGS